MKASKIEINGENRIKVEFPYNQVLASLLKQIPGAKWSTAIKAWHISYSKAAFDQLKKLFPEIEYPNKVSEVKAEKAISAPSVPEIVQPNSQRKDVSVEVIGRSIILKLPKNQLDIHFIKTLRYSRWDGKQFSWVVPNYPGNLDLIKEYFNLRIKNLLVHEVFDVKTSADSQRKIKANQLLIIKTVAGRLKLIFGFNKELSYHIKTMPFNSWDSNNKWWSIPYSEKFLNEIKTKALAQGLEIVYEEEVIRKEDKVKRISRFDIPNYRNCPDEYLRKLQELRYTKKTIKVYLCMFEEFINYYNTHDIIKIGDNLIIAFLQYLVIDRKVSPSYQNQSINAIKFYYERVMGGQRKFYFLDRPLKSFNLANVLNLDEISKTISLVKNIKHKAIIMITYGGGLRLSEVINLKIKDIDSKRMQIFVRQAKGRKDRYTLLSKKVVPVLREYYKEYKPKEWLFEGIKGIQYSESSVYTIVTKAFDRAGITKKASTHTLRHCFATHLLENGTDIRYIQMLMGHASIKTTEIYTHMTTKGFDKIENPLDGLEI
ncbi:MAG: tyrosine-type recombinase/integrase [Bacteroidetes bacterium]|nr:tyrosine-type recombinase/integrase [Bacteroidota bacterium]